MKFFKEKKIRPVFWCAVLVAVQILVGASEQDSATNEGAFSSHLDNTKALRFFHENGEFPFFVYFLFCIVIVSFRVEKGGDGEGVIQLL